MSGEIEAAPIVSGYRPGRGTRVLCATGTSESHCARSEGVRLQEVNGKTVPSPFEFHSSCKYPEFLLLRGIPSGFLNLPLRFLAPSECTFEREPAQNPQSGDSDRRQHVVRGEVASPQRRPGPLRRSRLICRFAIRLTCAYTAMRLTRKTSDPKTNRGTGRVAPTRCGRLKTHGRSVVVIPKSCVIILGSPYLFLGSHVTANCRGGMRQESRMT